MGGHRVTSPRSPLKQLAMASPATRAESSEPSPTLRKKKYPASRARWHASKISSCVKKVCGWSLSKLSHQTKVRPTLLTEKPRCRSSVNGMNSSGVANTCLSPTWSHVKPWGSCKSGGRFHGESRPLRAPCCRPEALLDFRAPRPTRSTQGNAAHARVAREGLMDSFAICCGCILLAKKVHPPRLAPIQCCGPFGCAICGERHLEHQKRPARPTLHHLPFRDESTAKGAKLPLQGLSALRRNILRVHHRQGGTRLTASEKSLPSRPERDIRPREDRVCHCVAARFCFWCRCVYRQSQVDGRARRCSARG
eukprot:1576253-Prymnesium_polylepis.2